MLIPLAEQLRPASLDDYLGQEHLIGKGAILQRAIESGNVPSMILWGSPGVGKTTLLREAARILAENKRVVIVEDSIVRGTTSKGRVRALRSAGVKEIHMRVSCPPLISPCFYGIDFPTKKELVAANHTIEEIREFIGVDSLKYLSLEGMLSSMMLPKEEFCTACFTGNYPTAICRPPSKKAREKTRCAGVKKT